MFTTDNNKVLVGTARAAYYSYKPIKVSKFVKWSLQTNWQLNKRQQSTWDLLNHTLLTSQLRQQKQN